MNQQWTVIGSGPAGILAIAKLIDSGIEPKSISWIAPTFTVGDLNDKWSQVPSNTTVKLFVDFLRDIKCIDFQKLSCPLLTLNPKDTCQLSYMVTPLQSYSDQLKTMVNIHQDTVQSLSIKNRVWQIKTKTNHLKSNNVILATGAKPTKLPIKSKIDSIWDGSNYFGASISALYHLGRNFNYSLVYAESKGVNLFFVRDDIIKQQKIKFLNINNVNQIYHKPMYGKGPNDGHPADLLKRKYLSSLDLVGSHK